MKIIDTAQAMPTSGHFVLAWLEGSKIPMRALWADKFSLGVSAEQDPEWGEYCEEKDEYFCPAGWYEMNQHEESHWRVDGNVVAWCELPRLDHQCLAQIVEPAAPAAVAGPADPLVWTPGPNEFKDWCAQWFGPDSDDNYLAEAVHALPPMAQRFARLAAAPALEAPAAPTLSIGPKLARILGYREHYRTWGRQLSDATELVESHPSHWRIVGEAMDELAAALAAAPQATAQEAPAAPAVPLKATPEMRAAFRRAYREGGFWDDRLDYALDQMLAAAPQAPAAPSADYARMYQNLADAMGYDSGKDGIEWSPEEWAAHLLAAYQAAPAAPAVDASDTALLDAMERERIAVIPEFEGPWDAQIFGEDEAALACGSGTTPREAITEALASLEARKDHDAAQAKEGGA